jgi:hypothetical protein
MSYVYRDEHDVPTPSKSSYRPDAMTDRVVRKQEIRELCRSGGLSEAEKLDLLHEYLTL